MATKLSVQNNGELAPGLCRPLYFESGDHALFGWLRMPPEQSNALGLVICNPFGYEAICAHRGVRAFAEAATAIGFPTLIFDYAGTGDSADLDQVSDQIQIWTRDVVTAVAKLQQLTGVKKVCLLGFRLGALIAACAAAECPASLGGLILISPVISGRRYLRELRTTNLAAMLGSDSCGWEESDQSSEFTSTRLIGSLEAAGFALSPATIERLPQIDLSKLNVSPAESILVIDGDSMAFSRSWAESMTSLGARVTYKTLPGLVQMLMTPPQFAQVPDLMVAESSHWLRGLVSHATANSAGADSQRSACISAIDLVASPTEFSIAHFSLTERPVFFGSDGILFGILTEPRPGEKRRRAIILINAGADYHIGANGMYVALARRWARQGYVVLRMDLAGLGDSGTRAGRADEEVFPPAAVDDVRAAIDLVQARYSSADITLAGLCSGAYHALRAAVARLPANRLLMINPQNYFWKEGMTVNDIQEAELVSNPARYRAHALSPNSWKRLLMGKVDLKYILSIFGNRALLTFESKARDFARRLRLHLPRDLGWELQELAARGVRVVFLFARGEPGIDLLKMQAGSAIKKIGAYCRVRIIDTGDHVFSKRRARAALEIALDEELFSRNDGSTKAPPQHERKVSRIRGGN